MSNFADPFIIGLAISHIDKSKKQSSARTTIIMRTTSSIRSHAYGVSEHALQAIGQLLPPHDMFQRPAFANRPRVTVVYVRMRIKPITQLEHTCAHHPGNGQQDTTFAN